MTPVPSLPHGERAGFVWFSERVQAAAGLGGEEALTALQILVADAEADKRDGYGPPQDDINKARRKWLAIYHEIYGGAA